MDTHQAWRMRGGWTVTDLEEFLRRGVREGLFARNALLYVSSDMEGNRISHLDTVEQDGERLVLFPNH